MHNTNKKITDGNTILANFLGGEVKVCYSIKDKDYYAWYGEMAIYFRKRLMKIPIGEVIALEQLEFHSNWLWLMPVVEELEEQYGFTVNIFRYKCQIIKADKVILEEQTNCKILSVWLALVNFIENHINKINENS